MQGFPWLSTAIFLPLLGALVTLFVPEAAAKTARAVALVFLSLSALCVLIIALGFHAGQGFQYVEQAPWMPALHVTYFLAVDGLSLVMLGLTAVIGIIAAIAAFGITDRVKLFYTLFLLLQTALLGIFCAEDLILFVFFFDVMLIPMYFIIGIWGHGRREYSALKFLIFTVAGSVVMLVGILALYFQTGQQTFSIPALAQLVTTQHVPVQWQDWIFLLIFAGLAVKLPVVPLHTWLPDAHVDAPTAGSVVLAAVMLKVGAYGFIRVSHYLLPAAASHFAAFIAVLGVINIVYGALAATAQHDFKKLVAYSSVSHMGFVLLGIAAGTQLAVTGAIFEMVSHGLVAGMLFLLVGVFYDRTHTREMTRFGGMYTTLGTGGGILGFAGMANLGLPALSGFIGEFFVLAGTFTVFRIAVFWAILGIVLIAGYNLWMMQKILMGPEKEEWKGLPRITRRELVTLVPLMAFCILLGLFPASIIHVLHGPVQQFVAHLGVK
ncbi:MAG TPA: NADH-quinone oxidoreductase subunit M [Bacillota bacterium]|nr:NADH-quinone oxidoreductase subunit M [Bacillota bacterium]